MGVVGCRFNPTEQELISHYLKKRASGIQLTEKEQGFFAERDLYGNDATPLDLLSDDLPWQTVLDLLNKVIETQKVLYLFTVLSYVGKKGTKNKNRVAGCGCWHANSSAKPVNDSNGKIIGESKDFTFRSKQETVGQWMMTEYSIDVSANCITDVGEGNCSDYVLCRIKRDDSKSSKNGRIVCRKRKLEASRPAEERILEKKLRPSTTQVTCEDYGSVAVKSEEMPSQEVSSSACYDPYSVLPPLFNVEDSDVLADVGPSSCWNIPNGKDFYLNSTCSFNSCFDIDEFLQTLTA